ncbi:MAG: hypothetical protein GY716_11475 [bacterium]|nr:hypothetical protein [bacterium]
MAAERGQAAVERPEVQNDVKRTIVALVAAWLVPGAGYVVLGHLRRGLIFGAIIWGCFGLGLAHEGRLALRDPQQPFLTGMQVVANLGIGPADLIARYKVYGELAYGLERPVMPNDTRAETFRQRARSGVSIYGTAYLWTAGLMNLLVLFDVWDIGRGRKAVA